MSTTDWTPPGWDVTEGPAEGTQPWRMITLSCRAEGCGRREHTAAPADVPTEKILALRADHQCQHAPERALDIEVQWIVSACCSVCEDEIGKVEDDGEDLICRECGTTWDREGTSGYRNEEDPR